MLLPGNPQRVLSAHDLLAPLARLVLNQTSVPSHDPSVFCTGWRPADLVTAFALLRLAATPAPSADASARPDLQDPDLLRRCEQQRQDAMCRMHLPITPPQGNTTVFHDSGHAGPAGPPPPAGALGLPPPHPGSAAGAAAAVPSAGALVPTYSASGNTASGPYCPVPTGARAGPSQPLAILGVPFSESHPGPAPPAGVPCAPHPSGSESNRPPMSSGGAEAQLSAGPVIPPASPSRRLVYPPANAGIFPRDPNARPRPQFVQDARTEANHNFDAEVHEARLAVQRHMALADAEDDDEAPDASNPASRQPSEAGGPAKRGVTTPDKAVHKSHRLRGDSRTPPERGTTIVPFDLSGPGLPEAPEQNWLDGGPGDPAFDAATGRRPDTSGVSATVRRAQASVPTRSRPAVRSAPALKNQHDLRGTILQELRRGAGAVQPLRLPVAPDSPGVSGQVCVVHPPGPVSRVARVF